MEVAARRQLTAYAASMLFCIGLLPQNQAVGSEADLATYGAQICRDAGIPLEECTLLPSNPDGVDVGAVQDERALPSGTGKTATLLDHGRQRCIEQNVPLADCMALPAEFRETNQAVRWPIDPFAMPAAASIAPSRVVTDRQPDPQPAGAVRYVEPAVPSYAPPPVGYRDTGRYAGPADAVSFLPRDDFRPPVRDVVAPPVDAFPVTAGPPSRPADPFPPPPILRSRDALPFAFPPEDRRAFFEERGRVPIRDRQGQAERSFRVFEAEDGRFGIQDQVEGPVSARCRRQVQFGTGGFRQIDCAF